MYGGDQPVTVLHRRQQTVTDCVLLFSDDDSYSAGALSGRGLRLSEKMGGAGGMRAVCGGVCPLYDSALYGNQGLSRDIDADPCASGNFGGTVVVCHS